MRIWSVAVVLGSLGERTARGQQLLRLLRLVRVRARVRVRVVVGAERLEWRQLPRI
jgi:hypothetical protein